MPEFTKQQVITTALDYLREEKSIDGDPGKCSVFNVPVPIYHPAEVGGKPAYTEYVSGQKWQVFVKAPRRALIIISREMDGKLHGEDITFI